MVSSPGYDPLVANGILPASVHDILNRVEAYRFLEAFSGGVDLIPNETFEVIHNKKVEKDNLTEDMIKNLKIKLLGK